MRHTRVSSGVLRQSSSLEDSSKMVVRKSDSGDIMGLRLRLGLGLRLRLRFRSNRHSAAEESREFITLGVSNRTNTNELLLSST